jgi:hypothetical protein
MLKDAYQWTFCHKGKTINAARYLQTLQKLHRALRDKRPRKKQITL